MEVVCSFLELRYGSSMFHFPRKWNPDIEDVCCSSQIQKYYVLHFTMDVGNVIQFRYMLCSISDLKMLWCTIVQICIWCVCVA